MKTTDLILASRTTPAKIARTLVVQARKDFVAQDVEQAVERALARFVDQLRQAAKQEIRFTGLNTPKIQ